MLSQGFRIQADVIVVAASIPRTLPCFYAPGQIVLREGCIVDVTGEVSSRPDANLEGYALLPGLVNPHTHLEFSDLTAPLPPGEHFPEWIASVLAARRQRGPLPETAMAQTIAEGLRQSRAAGVAALVDIVTLPWVPAFSNWDTAGYSAWSHLPTDLQSQLSLDSWQELQHHAPAADAMPAVIACLEQLGLSEDRMAPLVKWRNSILDAKPDRASRRLLALGLSPHAPYSTRQSLWRETFQAAADHQRLVAMHIAESAAERLWLDSGTGPFAELYAKLGVDVAQPPPRLIAELMYGLAQAPRGLLIHGNYLNEAEIQELSQYRERVSVVYCPRTHEHFQHAAYPLDEYSRRGIRVILGTDSRSTNPDLNLWQEARTALAKHKSLRPSEALSAISDSAAEAVGISDQFGSLRAGRRAALNAVRLTEPVNRNDIEAMIGAWLESVDHPVVLA